jgi:thiamine-monophosphate kinase
VGEAGLATAMMDLSDGLARDLPRLCARSGVGARVDPGLLPRGPSLAGVADPLPWQVAFGDDYQLLLSAPPEHARALRDLATSLGVRLTKIGVLTVDLSVELIGLSWPSPAFSHFEGSP